MTFPLKFEEPPNISSQWQQLIVNKNCARNWIPRSHIVDKIGKILSCVWFHIFVSTNFNAQKMNDLCGELIDITIFNTICKINFCLRIDITRTIIFYSYETNIIQRKFRLSTLLIIEFFGWLNGIFSHSRKFWVWQLNKKNTNMKNYIGHPSNH